MTFYAERGADGKTETLPDRSVTDYAYPDFHLKHLLKDEDQLESMGSNAYYDYYRVVPKDFVSDDVIAEGRQNKVYPNDIHKYTVVLWLEGDDPECTDALMGAAIGMNFVIDLVTPETGTPIITPESTLATTPVLGS